jgi:hypothetical protein
VCQWGRGFDFSSTWRPPHITPQDSAGGLRARPGRPRVGRGLWPPVRRIRPGLCHCVLGACKVPDMARGPPAAGGTAGVRFSWLGSGCRVGMNLRAAPGGPGPGGCQWLWAARPRPRRKGPGGAIIEPLCLCFGMGAPVLSAASNNLKCDLSLHAPGASDSDDVCTDGASRAGVPAGPGPGPGAATISIQCSAYYRLVGHELTAPAPPRARAAGPRAAPAKLLSTFFFRAVWED